MIAVRALTVGYPGTSFTLGPLSAAFGGPPLVIAGLAQSGKSTLLKALCGLVPASSGEIDVDDLPLVGARPQTLARLRSSFGMVFQSDALFDSMTALDNVALPLLRRHVAKPEAFARARQALAQVNLAEHEKVLPERLSGGMRKRLGLARAIVARPQYLLADDPLAGLDPGTSQKVIDLLFSLWEGRGGLVIAVADPAPFWERASEVMVLDDGKIVAHGRAAQVRSDPMVKRLFSAEAAA